MVMHPVVYSFPEIIKTKVNKINYTRELYVAYSFSYKNIQLI
jgi:hypothetical protein